MTDLRRATIHDAQGIAECWYYAFDGSELNSWLFPPSYPHRSAYIAQFARTQRLAILSGTSEVFVAKRGNRVVGYVTYKFIRDGRVVDRGTVLSKVGYSALSTWYAILGLWRKYILGLEFTEIENRFKLIGEAQELVVRENKGHPGPSEYLYITWLAVHPDAQGEGVSGVLLSYGVKSRLPLYLEASHMGHPVYLKRGFKDLKPRLEIRREDGSLVESLATMLYSPQ